MRSPRGSSSCARSRRGGLEDGVQHLVRQPKDVDRQLVLNVYPKFGVHSGAKVEEGVEGKTNGPKGNGFGSTQVIRRVIERGKWFKVVMGVVVCALEILHMIGLQNGLDDASHMWLFVVKSSENADASS